MNYHRNKKKGSILLVGVIFGGLLIISTAVLLQYGLSESQVNERHFLRLEAQTAAEAVADYGFAELEQRWLGQTSFPPDELKSDPLKLPGSLTGFFKESQIDLGSISITGGQVSASKWVFIDPIDPANLLDPQKNKRVLTRDVAVYAKATASAQAGHRHKDGVNAFCKQILQVRDAPLFAHAIFYNMDLEFHPGPRMDIRGPVHCNSNIYVQSGGGLYFHSNLMAAGNIWHDYKAKPGTKSSGHLGKVDIKSANGAWKSMYKGSGDKMSWSSYYDSYMGEDWKEAAEDRWEGTVASNDHEVPPLQAISIDEYVPDDLSTSSVNELENHSYALIEPQLPKSSPDFKGIDVQKQQFSYKAGLFLEVVEDASTPSGYNYNFYKYKRKSSTNPNSDPILSGSGTPTRVLLDKTTLSSDLIRIEKYKESSGAPTSGFYDQRQQQKLNVVDIDISELNKELTNGNPFNGTYDVVPGGSFDWNGTLYVEVPHSSSSGGRIDKVVEAKKDLAIRLVEGKTLPKVLGAPERGFTFATNGPLYIGGNYNSDGNSSTGSSTKADSTNEIPAALIADSITMLSSNWMKYNYDSKSKQHAKYRNASFTEVSAAIMTGLVPTINSTNTSGGNHNFPRFLERWSGDEFRYRGSMVALFESEAHKKPRPGNWSTYYSPPIRNWGWHEYFENGEMPPGTPFVRDFRRKNFKFLTEAEYTLAMAELK